MRPASALPLPKTRRRRGVNFQFLFGAVERTMEASTHSLASFFHWAPARLPIEGIASGFPMDPRDAIDPEQLESLYRAFVDQLLACLDECARGRRGLFAEAVSDGEEGSWPEAAQLRRLALALQAVYTRQGERNALCDEFLDLCSMHGESHPGERRLARAFLERIERGEVGQA